MEAERWLELARVAEQIFRHGLVWESEQPVPLENMLGVCRKGLAALERGDATLVALAMVEVGHIGRQPEITRAIAIACATIQRRRSKPRRLRIADSNKELLRLIPDIPERHCGNHHAMAQYLRRRMHVPLSINTLLRRLEKLTPVLK